MDGSNEALKHDIDELRQNVERLRDEVRVRLHLGAMDTREAFANIEHDMRHLGAELTHVMRERLADARTKLQKLRDGFEATKPQ